LFRTKKIRTALAAGAMTGALALSACAGGGGGGAAETLDPNEKVTLDFAFWGNDVRAAMYDEAIAAFNEKYPNITVNTSFLGFPEFWEKRQIEATSGGLPDVMQFDYSYLRQYSENGLLLDLGPYLGNGIDTEPLAQNILDIGVVNDTTYGITTSTNAWSMYQNPKLLDEVGVEAYEGGGSYDDYDAWIKQVTDAAKDKGVELWGGTDYTMRIQNFELWLRAQGQDLFSDDGKPTFTEDQLVEFWKLGDDIRSSGAVIPGQRLEEVYPLSGFDSALTASELTWDNFGAGYLGNLGEDYTELGLVQPPTAKEGSKDLYLKPSMLHAVAANTENPEAAIALVDFLVNAPETGAAFGTNRGLPASKTQLEGVEIEGLDTQIRDYETAIADRLGDAPPVPIVGYGTLEEKFRLLGVDLGLGVTTPEKAASEFFGEMDVVLNQ
jgi:multiple sugar transport system substrate-binding protein